MHTIAAPTSDAHTKRRSSRKPLSQQKLKLVTLRDWDPELTFLRQIAIKNREKSSSGYESRLKKR